MSDGESAQEERQLVVFHLADEVYGVDISTIDGIVRMQTITKVPRTLDFVEGVINLRGDVIPVVDMRKRFSLRVTEATKDSRIMVADICGRKIGMIVDAVTEVLRIAADAIEPPSSVITTASLAYLTGIARLEGRLIVILDLVCLFNSTEGKPTFSTQHEGEPQAQTETATATQSTSLSEAQVVPASAPKRTSAKSKKGQK
jgi:purine-binding chemotaxis protein CheW